jgi:hypothetical protein
MNTLCSARVPNHNPKSPISHFILMTLREYNDYDGGTYIDEIKSINDFVDNSYKAIDDPFYRIYGEKRENNPSPSLVFIAEFFDLKKAKDFLYNITGEYPIVISY